MSHNCNNFVLICMDFRFQSAVANWLKEQGVAGNYDLISLAGAQKAIVDLDTRETVLKQLNISVDLHQASTVYIIAHQDCGAYGGSKAFGNWKEEKAKYIADMNEAEKLMKEKFPELTVKKAVLQFSVDGEININNV